MIQSDLETLTGMRYDPSSSKYTLALLFAIGNRGFSDRSKMASFSDLYHLSIPNVSLGDGAVVYHCRGR